MVSDGKRLMRRGAGRWLGMVLVVWAFVGGYGLLGGSGSATAAAQSFCGYGSSSGNVRTCVHDSRSAVSSSATVVHQARVLQSCLHRNGARVGCSAYTYVRPGAGVGFTWIPSHSVPGGTYCAVTWRKNANGSTTRIGSQCFGITSIG